MAEAAFPKDVTDRRPDVGEGEGWKRRGGPTGSTASPRAGGGETDEHLSKRLACCGQQLSVCDRPLQLHHGDGDASQKLVAT